MRSSCSVAACLAVLLWVGAARADTPPDVYSDYAEDGVLSCGHSSAALKGVLTDASIHQYGDPLTFLGLKLAVRAQLAGGCRRASSATAADDSPDVGVAGGTTGGSGPATGAARPAGKGDKPGAKAGQPPPEAEDDALSGGNALRGDDPGSGQDGRMTLLGVVLLLLTLGSGGWAARRAFSDRL